MKGALRVRGCARTERTGDFFRIALEVTVDVRQAQVTRDQRCACVEREGVAPGCRVRRPRDLSHELPADALGREVGADLVLAVGIRLPPGLEEIGWLPKAEALIVVTLRPRQLFQALDDVVGVTKAHHGGARQLFQPPGAARLAQHCAHDAGRPRREQRAQWPRGRPHVALALFFDQNVFERHVAVAGEIDVAEVVALEDSRALRRDIDGCGQGVGGGDLPTNLAQPRHGRPDLSRLSERAHFSDQQVLLLAKPKLHHEIRGLAANGDVLALLPGFCPREYLSEALHSLSPDFRGFEHVSFAPPLSASAETLRTTETPCQVESYFEA